MAEQLKNIWMLRKDHKDTLCPHLPLPTSHIGKQPFVTFVNCSYSKLTVSYGRVGEKYSDIPEQHSLPLSAPANLSHQ